MTVGIIRIMCHGVCTSRRFHSEEDDQNYRPGCQDQPDCLLHYNECPGKQCLACASADDFSVAAPSFRTLVLAIAPAFRTVDKVTGMNLSDKCVIGFNMAVKHVAAYTDGWFATVRILKK